MFSLALVSSPENNKLILFFKREFNSLRFHQKNQNQGGSMKLVVVFISVVATRVLTAWVSAIPVFFLWNWLMPEIFNVKVLSFIQAVGVSLLADCLFKNYSYNSGAAR